MLVVALFIARAAEDPAGTPFPGVPFVQDASLRTRARVEPVWPSVSEAERGVRHRCIGWVKVGPDGRAGEVVVDPEHPGDGCTAPFQAAWQEALRGWRWEPVKIDREKAEIHTHVAWVFPAQAIGPVRVPPPPEPAGMFKTPIPVPMERPVASLAAPPAPSPVQPMPEPTPAPTPAPAVDPCAPLGAEVPWTSCAGRPVTVEGRIAEIPHAHPVSVGPEGGTPVYVEVPGIGQIVAVAASTPSCAGPVTVAGVLRRVDLGGEAGTRGSYQGWSIDGASVTCQ